MNFFDFSDNLNNYSAVKLLDDLQVQLEKTPEATDLIKQQWNEGIGSDGKILGRYSKATEIITNGRKVAGTTYDIFDTGETRQKLTLFGFQKSGDIDFLFESDSQAMPELLQRIPADILLGYTEKDKDKFTAIAVEKAIILLNTNLKLR
ncbi:MAG: hypothetical protein H7101_11310 [Deinococcales bacterium]|nr:hypothetical protein [Chitinophagaceae bacterium]